MPDINDLQTHKWVLPIKGNTDLPTEQQGYLMIRELTPFSRPEMVALAGAGATSQAAVAAGTAALEDHIISVHNLNVRDASGAQVPLTDPKQCLRLFGSRLIEKLTSFMLNPVSEQELGK